jgi:membrane-associated phospholipid phosphatase
MSHRLQEIMQPQTESKVRAAWEQFAIWVNHHQRVARLVTLTAGLIVYLVFLPATIRIFFWSSLKSNQILASMLLIFGLLGISLVWTTGQKIDSWAFLFFNLRGRRPIWLDRVMLGFTQIGNGIAALGIALALFLAGDTLLAYDLMLSTLSLWLLVELMKFLIHRSRPFIRLTQARIIGRQAIGRSFPSGHTSQVFLLASLLTQHYHPSVWVVFLMYAVAAFVGITRMYVGAHYPRDVLAGAILGSAWGLLGGLLNAYFLGGIG